MLCSSRYGSLKFAPRWREGKQAKPEEDLTMKQATANRPAKVCGRAKGAETFDVRKLKLVPILKRREKRISLLEAVRRARANPITNHGKRFVEKVAAALNTGGISKKVWHVRWYVIFARGTRGSRYRHEGRYFVWFIERARCGFYIACSDFTGNVGSDGRLLVSGK